MLAAPYLKKKNCIKYLGRECTNLSSESNVPQFSIGAQSPCL